MQTYDRSFRFLATDFFLFFLFSVFHLRSELTQFGWKISTVLLLSLSKAAAAAAAASFIVQPCNCVTYRHSPFMARVHWFFRHPRHIQGRCSSYHFLSTPTPPPPLPLWTELQLAAKILPDFFHVHLFLKQPAHPHFTEAKISKVCVSYIARNRIILRLRNENGTEINMQRLSFE